MGSTQSEIEIKQKRSLTSTQEIINLKRFDLMQDKPHGYGNEYSDQFGLVKDDFVTDQEKLRVYDNNNPKATTYMTTEDKYSPMMKNAFDINLDNLQFRYGKTYEELHYEYDSVLQCLQTFLKDLLVASNVNQKTGYTFEESMFALLNEWKVVIYDNICRKTGEVKNFVSFNALGKSFKLLHEVDSWKEIELLKTFCENTGIAIDNLFFEESKRKLDTIGSLTVQIWIELSDCFAELETTVGFNLTKPSDKKLIEKFLAYSVEKNNILTWFDANNPVPIEYGFGVGEGGNELLIGFYFFDGPLNINLGRSLTAFQAYGADINQQLVEIFKMIPSEEYKVSFVISSQGVQKVRMLINKLNDDVEKKMLGAFSSTTDLQNWNYLKKAFEPMTIKHTYILDYSNEGFQLYCVNEVGGEITSRIYIEDG